MKAYRGGINLILVKSMPNKFHTNQICFFWVDTQIFMATIKFIYLIGNAKERDQIGVHL